MHKNLALIAFCNIVAASTALAQNEKLQLGPYELSHASTLVNVCSLGKSDVKGTNCLSYVTAISDLYFLMNPQCTRPDHLAFNTQVYRNITNIAGNMPQDQLATESAASIVFQAVTTAYPCQVAERLPAKPKPDPTACKKGLEYLGNDWVNSFEKQAILETLRNSGCLNQ